MKEFARRIVPKFLWGKFRELRIARGVKRFRRRVVEHDYCGHRLKVLIADGIGESWYDRDWESLEEIDVLASGNLRSGATVFDLGAHQGVVAMIMAKIVGETGKVIAVEGTKHNCDVGSENLKINNIGNVVFHHAVIADHDGQIRFFEGLNGSVTREGTGTVVEAITIDSLVNQYGAPDVVFIDIEGFESQALKGASKALELSVDWFIEVHVGCGLEEYGSSAKEVLDCFPESDYDRLAWNLDSGQKPKPITADDPGMTSRFALVAMRKKGVAA